MKNKITQNEILSFTKTMATGFESFKKEIREEINKSAKNEKI